MATHPATLSPLPCRGCPALARGCELAAAAAPYAPECELARFAIRAPSLTGSAPASRLRPWPNQAGA